MNVKSIVSLVFFLTILSVNAQQPVTPDYAKAIGEVTIGIKGGLNSSKQIYKFSSDSESVSLSSSALTNFHIGLFATIPISEKFQLQPEVLYSVEGSKVNLFIAEFEQEFSFLKVPVLLSTPILKNLKVQAGPQFGFILDERLDVPADEVEILEGAYKSFEISAVVGVEYDILEKLLAGARYNIGLTDLSDIPEGSLKSNTFQLYVGWRLF